ncbi:hypothetical protein HZY83_07495 [Gemella sp. GH3]|uniref:hypothetical protein n=1 Tax=unclassified Gemella TaxID=2624949 RepID=UPI0015D07B58|nr:MULTISPECIES: hypothetical protein [unclassified Gemella]MBF0714518.1 hypothetical protein [Gemella sp. GH3.1]NYS51470.1 hypothetical protein [Gemella sp. GH3]
MGNLTTAIRNGKSTIEGLYTTMNDFNFSKNIRKSINEVISSIQEEIDYWEELKREENGE